MWRRPNIGAPFQPMHRTHQRLAATCIDVHRNRRVKGGFGRGAIAFGGVCVDDVAGLGDGGRWRQRSPDYAALRLIRVTLAIVVDANLVPDTVQKARVAARCQPGPGRRVYGVRWGGVCRTHWDASVRCKALSLKRKERPFGMMRRHGLMFCVCWEGPLGGVLSRTISR